MRRVVEAYQYNTSSMSQAALTLPCPSCPIPRLPQSELVYVRAIQVSVREPILKFLESVLPLEEFERIQSKIKTQPPSMPHPCLPCPLIWYFPDSEYYLLTTFSGDDLDEVPRIMRMFTIEICTACTNPWVIHCHSYPEWRTHSDTGLQHLICIPYRIPSNEGRTDVDYVQLIAFESDVVMKLGAWFDGRTNFWHSLLGTDRKEILDDLLVRSTSCLSKQISSYLNVN